MLYRLPDLIELSSEFPDLPIFICEGEKDVERCYELGASPATCIRGGASAKWQPEFNQYFAGMQVAILANIDLPGRDFANRIAKELRSIAGTIKVVKFPELPDHGDVSDFFEAGNSVDALYERINATSPWVESVAEQPVKAENKRAAVPVNSIAGAQRTDLANSRRLAHTYADVLKHCPPWKRFYVFDGVRWNQDNQGSVDTFAKEVADRLWNEAQASGNDEALRFVSRSASHRGIKAMVGLAQSEPPLAIQPDQFDRHSLLLNCPNGTVDLQNGILRPHSGSDFLTQLCPTHFAPDARCPYWKRAIKDIFGDDPELIRFVQRLFGMCLTGLVSEQVLVIFVGSGSNGKSLLLNVLLSVLGPDYFIKASDEILVRKRNSTHPTALADLFRKRLAVVMETESGDRIAEALIKALTGGDRIRARRMREDFWEFSPTHKIILCTNHKPRVDATDHALWRRVRLVPFKLTFVKGDDPSGSPPDRAARRLQADPNLQEKVLAEAEGILAWAVKGCLDWQTNGLGSPPAIAEATRAYRDERDTLQRFLDDKCLLSPEEKVRSQPLFDAFQTWCDNVGERSFPLNQFKQRLLEHSCGVTFKRSNGSWFHGLSLRKR